MQVQMYSVPLFGGQEIINEMNRFIRSHRVIEVEKQTLLVGATAYVIFYVHFVEGNIQPETKKEKIDYAKILGKKKGKVFEELRVLRKQLAEEQNVPVYNIFNNAELAKIAELDVISPAEVLKIKGVGKAKLESYGIELIQRYEAQNENETDGLPDF